MFYLLIFTIGLLTVYLLSSRKRCDGEFMSLVNTMCIKGFAILLVVWGHLGSVFGVNHIQFIAGIGVALFTICSGYGIHRSCVKGTHNYWKKRITSVVVPFYFVSFWEMVLKRDNSILDIILFKNSWYIGFILACYFIYWIVFRVSKKFKTMCILLFIGFGIWFLLESLILYDINMPELRARQIFLFPVGVLLSEYKDIICEKIKGHRYMIGAFALGVGGVLMVAFIEASLQAGIPIFFKNVESIFSVGMSAISVLILCKLFPKPINNPFLFKCGKYSFEIFLLHWIILEHIEKNLVGLATFCIILIVLTVILNYLIMKIKYILIENKNRV